MNINDLDDYEVEKEATPMVKEVASNSPAPMNLSDLGNDFEVEEVPTSSEERSMNPGEAQAYGVAAGLGTEGVIRGASALGGKALEKLGKLNPEDIKLISQDPATYKKARKYSDLLEKVRETAQQNRESAFNYAKQAKESLKGLPDVDTKQVIKSISNIKSAPLVEVPENELPKATANKTNIARLEQLAKQKEQLAAEIKRRLETGIESPGLNQELDSLQKQAGDVDNSIKSTMSKALEDYRNPIQPTMEDFSKSSGIPESILEQNPSLKTKRIQPEFGNVLKQEAEFLKSGTISPYELGHKYIPGLQDKTTYQGIPDQAAKFKQEIARNVSEDLKNLPGAEDYARKQELSKKAIEIEEGLNEYGLGLNSSDEAKITGKNKIKEIYKTKNAPEIKRLEGLLKDAQDLGLNPKSNIDAAQLKQIDRFQSEFPLATVKNTVETAPETWLSRLTKGSAGYAVGGPVGAITANAALPTGTKMQEAIAIAKGSKTAKALGTASKFAGPLVGLGVAGLSYKDARDRGLSTPEAIGATAGEVLNPIPYTDVTGAYIAGKNEYEKALPESEETTVSKVIKATPAAAMAAGEAFIKPMGQANIHPGSMYPSFAMPKPKPAEADKKIEKLETKDPNELKGMLDLFGAMPDNKAAQEYSNVLAKVIEAPENQKDALLFGLNQQPAFRELLRKAKGEA